MKNLVYQRLKEWSEEMDRKPLILRGARQVGKSYAVQKLGESFDNFIEVDFEFSQNFLPIFEEDLDPQRIVQQISVLAKQKIIPGKTLLFFDEIQFCPRAITSLRYFYEKMPKLHVIAAGSLLEFAHELVGIPVGRVQSLYVHPMTFFEYLAADGEGLLLEQILKEEKLSEVVHKKILKHVGIYLALGGMPEVLRSWIKHKDPLRCSEKHATLLDTYRQDFQRYAKKSNLKYLSLLFENIPRQLGEKFKFSKIGEYQKRELEPSLELLLTANIFNKVVHTSAQGIPIGAEANPERFKLLFIDVGLTQALLSLELSAWFIQPEAELVNKGKIVEAFVGQELLAYSEVNKKSQLHYWQRDSRESSAEIDYVLQKKQQILPIEVKSVKTMKLKSLHSFLKTHSHSEYGVKISIDPYYKSDHIESIPLYKVGSLVGELKTIESLLFP
ncbi:ATP-binding protein [Candidatus Neptunochlamydia vexilliferae]|uniref:ATP-binding protein n=1 Tax=Candidatus Neptunichlamydia vexilliferae TaxID=1651774 RepID=UPI001891AC7F|nr:AAA family ATPase [Candidatus Neptunochlamydia vexilliferae]